MVDYLDILDGEAKDGEANDGETLDGKIPLIWSYTALTFYVNFLASGFDNTGYPLDSAYVGLRLVWGVCYSAAPFRPVSI